MKIEFFMVKNKVYIFNFFYLFDVYDVIEDAQKLTVLILVDIDREDQDT